MPAVLGFSRQSQREQAEVELADVSAGGAKIIFGEGSLGVGDAVRLALQLDEEDRERIPDAGATAVVMTARVVWTRPLDAEVGLIFAGAPRYAASIDEVSAL